MRKFYFYLTASFMLMATGYSGGQTLSSGKPKKHTPIELKYPGPSGMAKASGSSSSEHRRIRKNKPVMKTDSDKQLWGFLLIDENEDYLPGAGTFTLGNASAFTTVWPSELNVSAGACIHDVMYVQTYSVTRPVSFFTIDLLTGEEKKIRDYVNTNPILRDMTYDYSTNTLYGIGSEFKGEVSFLYSIDPSTGDITELFPLDYDLVTLAADNEGNMYGITSDGDFCRVMMEEQYLEVIGFTNEFPMYLQSMDFDRNDNTLYWAGFTEEGTSFLATVDVETGEAVRIATPLGANAEVLALHVPTATQSPDAPAAIENLTVVAGERGALTANLSWTNPSQTIAGEALTNLTKIDIYRNKEIVHTVENPVAGETLQWTDNTIEESGYVVYKLIPSNETGEGRAVKSDLFFVGRDVPGQVGDPVMTKKEEGYVTHISWSAPVSSVNGGWWDVDGLTYDVIRYPENRTIAENLMATTYTDETITGLNAYYYEIVPKTPDGQGIGTLTNKMFVGPSRTLPYFCNFSTEEARNLWIIEDANHDGYTWTFGHNYKGTSDWFLEYNIFNYDVQPTLAADEWFFSAPFKLTSGRKYTLMFRVRLGGDLAQEKFRTVLCSDANAGAQVKTIGDYTTLNDQSFQSVTEIFEVSETGEYHIGFQCYSDPDQWMVQITDISLEESLARDMEGVLIKGMPTPVQNDTTSYEVTIRNNGFENVSTCSVQVIDENANVLGANKVRKELVPQESLIVEVKCVIPVAGNMKLSGRVVLEGDENDANDVSAALDVEVLRGDDFIWKNIGSKEAMEYSPNYPFMTDRRYSYSQTLYLPSDLKFASGKIERLAYYYYIMPLFGKPAKNMDVRISLANTGISSLLDEYVPESQFTEVYRGVLSIDSLNNVLSIELDTPFEYTGQNLCILTERMGEHEGLYTGNNFLYTIDEDVIGEGRTRYYGSLDVPFGPDVESLTSQRLPNVSLLVNKSESSVKEERVTALPEVFPNPVTDRLNIRGEYVTAKLYSVNGRFVCEAAKTGVTDVSALDRGIYFLQVNTGDDVHVYKIVLK